MRSFRSLWWLAALALSGCSLISDFDPEGQPCDAQGRCLEGYVCRDKVCVASPGAGADGGTLGGNRCEASDGCPEAPAEAR
jgi:hypothetical protein